MANPTRISRSQTIKGPDNFTASFDSINANLNPIGIKVYRVAPFEDFDEDTIAAEYISTVKFKYNEFIATFSGLRVFVSTVAKLFRIKIGEGDNISLPDNDICLLVDINFGDTWPESALADILSVFYKTKVDSIHRNNIRVRDSNDNELTPAIENSQKTIACMYFMISLIKLIYPAIPIRLKDFSTKTDIGGVYPLNYLKYLEGPNYVGYYHRYGFERLRNPYPLVAKDHLYEPKTLALKLLDDTDKKKCATLLKLLKIDDKQINFSQVTKAIGNFIRTDRTVNEKKELKTATDKFCTFLFSILAYQTIDDTTKKIVTHKYKYEDYLYHNQNVIVSISAPYIVFQKTDPQLVIASNVIDAFHKPSSTAVEIASFPAKDIAESSEPAKKLPRREIITEPKPYEVFTIESSPEPKTVEVTTVESSPETEYTYSGPVVHIKFEPDSDSEP